MRHGLVTTLFFLLTGLINLVFAQQQIFKNYTINDGLISNSIRRIFQDSKGFIWIATWEGLSKYDGNTFTNFSTANGLSHNMVNDFYESAGGNLYVALNNGCIDIIADDKITSNAVPATGVVNRFLYTRAGQALATTDLKGVQEFNNGKLQPAKQTYAGHSYLDISWLNDSLFMVGGDSSIAVFNKKYEFVTGISQQYAQFSGSKIFRDSKNRIWLGTYNGLKLLDGFPRKNCPITFTSAPKPFDIPALQKGRINDILEDASGTMWFGTAGGLVKIGRDNLPQLISVNEGLPSNIVTNIYQDKEQNIWFGTAVGLSKLVTRAGILLYPMANGVSSNDNLFILYPVKKDHLLVSAANGLNSFNKLTGKFKQVTNEKNQLYYNVVQQSNPPLLIGLNSTATFDTITMQVSRTNFKIKKGATRMLKDKKGNFFLSQLNELYYNSGTTFQKILNHRITDLLIDKKGDLWAGTWENGLFHIQYNFYGNKLHILESNHLLPNEEVRSLFEDSRGNIWAGTRYRGVYRIQNNNRNFSILNFDQDKGLSSNFVKQIREDKNGNFWIAFYQGLDKLIPGDSTYQVFNFSRINNYYASIIGMEADEDQSLWLATGEGLAHVTDGKLEKSPPLPVFITRVYSTDSIYSAGKNIKLNYRQDQLQFEFSSPGFINEKQVLYSYRLSGSSVKEWTKATNQHSVSYASLRPGNYLFEVRSLGWNGEWGKAACIGFIITPPFWLTWWFISIVSLCIFSFVYLLVKWRENNIKLIEAAKLKVQQLSAEQYKSKLELEQIINYFSSSLIDKNTVDDVLWDVAKNLIGRLGFTDCMIYLWNSDKTKMVQRAGFGPKGSIEGIREQPFDVHQGEGVVGHVMHTKEPVLIHDTSLDSRYRIDEMIRLSEISVPIIYNDDLIGVIDSEHHEKNFYTPGHLQILSTIATLMANKIMSIEAEQLLQRTHIEMYSMKEQLSKAKLEALRAQMNPHFIFNCLTSIDNLIQMDEKEKATLYLSKFAKLIRSILDNSTNDVVSCWKDMETLQLYLELEALRFDNKFKYQVNIAGEIMSGDYKVPPLVVQPFVENAIHHGLLNKIEPDKKLRVDVFVSNNHIHYLIEDNGVGRANAAAYKQLNKAAYESVGMQITSDRINLVNNYTNGSLKITDLVNENGTAAGTKVEVTLINQP